MRGGEKKDEGGVGGFGKVLCILHTHRSYIQPWIKYVYTHSEAGNGSIYSFIRTHPFNPAGGGGVGGGDVAYPIYNNNIYTCISLIG